MNEMDKELAQYAKDVMDWFDMEDSMPLNEYIRAMTQNRRARKIRERLTKLERRVKFFPPLKYLHGKTIEQLTAELVALRLEE